MGRQFAPAAEAQFAPAAEAQFAPAAEAVRSAGAEVAELVTAVRTAGRDDRFDHILRLIEADFGELG
jgi:hypothetical protein